MAPTQQRQAAQNGAQCYGVKTAFRIAKNTTIRKAPKKKSSNILFRALKKTAEAYGLELTNAIRLWASIGGRSRSQFCAADGDPWDENTPNDGLSQAENQDEVENGERYTTEFGDDECTTVSAEAETMETGGGGGQDDDKHAPFQSYYQYEGIIYDGDSKDALFNGGDATVPAGLSRRAAGGDEDEEYKMNGSSTGSGSGGSALGGSGEKYNGEVEPSSLDVTTTERQPSIRLENCEDPCEWPDCSASVRNFARKSPHDEESLEGDLEVFHSSARNPALPRGGYESTGLSEDWSYKGNAPSRERNERYDGGAKDRLFNGGRGRVPAGLSRKAVGGNGGNEDESTGGSAGGSGDGRGGGGGDEDGNDGDDGEHPKDDWTKGRSYERRRIENRTAQRQYRKQLKHRLQELERRARYENADAPQMHVEGGGQQEIVDKQFIEGFGHQKAHLASQCFPSQELDAKSKGMTPSRGVNECYDGGSKDRLFIGGGASVPKGLSGRAGEDRGDEDEEMGGSGNGGGGDDGNGHEGTQNSVQPSLTSLQDYQMQLMLLEQQNKKRLKQQRKQLEVSLQECGCKECAIWEQQLDQYPNLAEIQRWFFGHLERQGDIIAPPNADDFAVYNTISEWLSKRQGQQRGSAPSRGMNECYNGGAEDALFAGGGAQVPRGLINSAAGRGREGSDLPMGGSGGGDDEDDGDGSNGSDARLDEGGHPKPHPLQGYQEQMLLLEQLNKRTWMTKHGRGHQLHERNSEDDGDYEMEDAWEREEAPKSVVTGETDSSFQFQYELEDELMTNPWAE